MNKLINQSIHNIIFKFFKLQSWFLFLFLPLAFLSPSLVSCPKCAVIKELSF